MTFVETETLHITSLSGLVLSANCFQCSLSRKNQGMEILLWPLRDFHTEISFFHLCVHYEYHVYALITYYGKMRVGGNRPQLIYN